MLETLNKGGQRKLSKIVRGDKTYISFYDIPTHQQSHKDALTPRAMKKVMYTLFTSAVPD